MRFSAAGREIEFGDLLLFFYALIFFRQCAWVVHNDFMAWFLASAGSSAAWFAYLHFKPRPDERTPAQFWVIVALPLLIIYAVRAPIPDLSFDVLNHRLIQGERALRGPQFLSGDFFPNVLPFNPSSDMLTGLFRHALGYRLGTIVNLLALIWAGTILEKMLRPWFARAWQRCLGVLLVLFTEHIMFEISTYMVDLLALPLLLEALRLALDYDQSKTRRRDLLWSALLLGGAVGLKLTNVAMVLPLLIVFAVRVSSAGEHTRQLKYVVLAAILFLLPLLPHAIYIYRETGNPVFPLYNNIFGSPYWSRVPFSDGRWGPKSWGETLYWPLVSFWVPKRLSELAVYAGRLTLGVVAAIMCLLFPRANGRARPIAQVVLIGSVLWAATSGYVRYALFLEILGGMLILYLSNYIWQKVNALPQRAKLALAALPVFVLASQCALSAVYLRRTEWSLRPMALDDPEALRRESRWIFRDRDLSKFQSVENRQLFSQVDGWIVSSVKSNGVEVLLRPDVPMLGVNYPEYFGQPEARRRFANALEGLRGKHIYSLTLHDEFDSAVECLRLRSLRVGLVQDVIVPFFSGRTQFHMRLIEVQLPAGGPPRKQPGPPEATQGTGPLEDEAFHAGLSATGVRMVMKPGQTATISVAVKNLSDYVWPSKPGPSSIYQVNVADAWLQPDATTLVNNLDGRSGLPRDLWPGEAAEVPLTINAPGQPGNYILEIDLVQEGVAFFKERGSPTWRARIKVE